VLIVGVGFDSPEDNQAWADEEGFAFELWSDEDKTLALHYGAAASESAVIPGRVTRVLDSNGDLVVEYLVSSLDAHPEQVLEDCRLLFGGD
jgi:thioredoxin-dependent peroxiredoxin